MTDIDFDALAGRGLFVATPMYGGQAYAGYTRAIAKVAQLSGAHCLKFDYTSVVNQSLVPLARNSLCNEFLKSDCEHLLFWDADVEINPLNVFELMQLQAQDERFDVIGAVYPVKKVRWDVVAKAVNAGVSEDRLHLFQAAFPFNTVDEGIDASELMKPLEVKSLTTGMMMIRRSALKRFAEAYPRARYKDRHKDGPEIIAFFQGGLDEETGAFLPEDFHFCKMVRDIGLNIWACPWMATSHTGTHEFIGSITSLMSVGVDINQW